MLQETQHSPRWKATDPSHTAAATLCLFPWTKPHIRMTLKNLFMRMSVCLCEFVPPGGKNPQEPEEGIISSGAVSCMAESCLTQNSGLLVEQQLLWTTEPSVQSQLFTNFLRVYMYVCYLSGGYMYAGACWGQQRVSDPLELEWDTWVGPGEPNLAPLGEQQSLVTTEHLCFKRNIYISFPL